MGQGKAGMKGQIHFPGCICQRLEQLLRHCERSSVPHP